MRTSLLGFLGYREERNDWPLNHLALLSFILTLFISGEFRGPQLHREQNCTGGDHVWIHVGARFPSHHQQWHSPIRELNSQILLLLLFLIKAQNHMLSPAHRAGWNRLLHPCLLRGAPHESHCGEFSQNSLRPLFTLSHFIFSHLHAVLLRFHLGILLKSLAYLLMIYQGLLQACVPSVCQKELTE